jgi:hypothetical protein
MSSQHADQLLALVVTVVKQSAEQPMLAVDCPESSAEQPMSSALQAE